MESIFFSFPSLPLSLSCLFTRTINLDGASGYATGFDRKGGKKKREKIKKDTAIVRKRKYVFSVWAVMRVSVATCSDDVRETFHTRFGSSLWIQFHKPKLN